MTTTPPAVPVQSRDEEQLKLLAVFHYVVAGLGAVFACFPLIHVAIGTMIVTNPGMLSGSARAPAPPAGFR
jgi:hypothetical protein